MEKHVAFFSYTRSDDDFEGGALTKICEALGKSLQFLSGRKPEIFLDVDDIKPGQKIRQRIEQSLNEVFVLIPILTPSYFTSAWCREELELFLEREKALGRDDLIVAIYYQTQLELELARQHPTKGQTATDPLIQEAAARLAIDWRPLRGKEVNDQAVRKELESIAQRINEIMKEIQTVPPVKKSAKSTPLSGTVHVVDSRGYGQFSTIVSAIERASAGDRIYIAPGHYQGMLRIRKPLEIIGLGNPANIIVEASGETVLLFEASHGRVVNLTLRHGGRGVGKGAIIRQGNLELEGCDISGCDDACVLVQGSAAPILRRNQLHDGKVGILVSANAQGTMEHNHIFANAEVGVAIEDGANPYLRDNLICDNRGYGINVYNSGQGALENNIILNNGRDGVAVATDGNPTLRRNRISGNTYQAVLVARGGRGVFEDNDLRGNREGTWRISPDSEPYVSRTGNLED